MLTAAILAPFMATGPVAHADGAVVVAPFDGPFALIGQSIARAANAQMGPDVPQIDDACQTEAAARAARDVLEAGDRLVIGLPCIDAFDGASPLLAENGVPILAVGLQAPDITTAPRDASADQGADTDQKDWPVFRIGPVQGEEWAVLARYIAANWRDESFAIIDDGTLYGRQLAKNVRLILSDSALEPVFVDTFRPLLDSQAALVRRLQRSGASHVIIGGEARDAAIIGADAQSVDYDLTIAGGSVLRAPPSDGRLPDGTVMAAIAMTTDLPLVAAQVARQALAEADEANTDVAAALLNGTFDTQAGSLTFGADGEPDREFFVIHQKRDGRFVPLADLDG